MSKVLEEFLEEQQDKNQEGITITISNNRRSVVVKGHGPTDICGYLSYTLQNLIRDIGEDNCEFTLEDGYSAIHIQRGFIEVLRKDITNFVCDSFIRLQEFFPQHIKLKEKD